MSDSEESQEEEEEEEDEECSEGCVSCGSFSVQQAPTRAKYVRRRKSTIAKPHVICGVCKKLQCRTCIKGMFDVAMQMAVNRPEDAAVIHGDVWVVQA